MQKWNQLAVQNQVVAYPMDATPKEYAVWQKLGEFLHACAGVEKLHDRAAGDSNLWAVYRNFRITCEEWKEPHAAINPSTPSFELMEEARAIRHGALAAFEEKHRKANDGNFDHTDHDVYWALAQLVAVHRRYFGKGLDGASDVQAYLHAFRAALQKRNKSPHYDFTD